MTPEELRAAFIKSRGLNLTSTPVVPPSEIPVAPPTVVQTQPIVPTVAPPVVVPPPSPVVRLGADGKILGNQTSNRIDNPDEWKPQPQVVPPVDTTAPYAKPSAFPTEGAAPVPNVAAGSGPAGITLNSAPVAPGWAGTVGLPASPEESKGFDKGQKYNEALAGLEQIAKGLKPKAAADTGMNTITPMNLQPNQPSNMSAELMGQILNNRRRKYGVSLAG